MPMQNDVLENALREHITELLKNMKLESKTEEYYHPHKGEEIVSTWYWDNERCDWRFKDDVVRSNINKSLRPIIDKIMQENKDMINFFL
jgi:hypothetical protein